MADQPVWDTDMQQLLQDGIISGYALISKQGSTQAAGGLLSNASEAGEHVSTSSPACAHTQLQQFVKAFPDSGAPPSAFQVAGRRAVVFRRTECDIHAISCRRKLGLCVHALPFGILVVTYSRRTLPQEVVPKVLHICDTLRS